MTVALLLMLAGCTFECGGKDISAAVPFYEVCDGVVDCWHGQDENVDDCPTELFYCNQPGEAQAILAEQVCDGVEDCVDGFDEADCL